MKFLHRHVKLHSTLWFGCIRLRRYYSKEQRIFDVLSNITSKKAMNSFALCKRKLNTVLKQIGFKVCLYICPLFLSGVVMVLCLSVYEVFWRRYIEEVLLIPLPFRYRLHQSVWREKRNWICRVLFNYRTFGEYVFEVIEK